MLLTSFRLMQVLILFIHACDRHACLFFLIESERTKQNSLTTMHGYTDDIYMQISLPMRSNPWFSLSQATHLAAPIATYTTNNNNASQIILFMYPVPFALLCMF